MGIYTDKQVTTSQIDRTKRVATVYEEVKTRPGYEIDTIKREKLKTTSIPACNMDMFYDYNQVGLVATDNTFAVRVSDLIQGMDESKQAVILTKLANNSGYITSDFKPLARREEDTPVAKTCYNGRDSYFWSKGSNA